MPPSCDKYQVTAYAARWLVFNHSCHVLFQGPETCHLYNQVGHEERLVSRVASSSSVLQTHLRYVRIPYHIMALCRAKSNINSFCGDSHFVKSYWRNDSNWPTRSARLVSERTFLSLSYRAFDEMVPTDLRDLQRSYHRQGFARQRGCLSLWC